MDDPVNKLLIARTRILETLPRMRFVCQRAQGVKFAMIDGEDDFAPASAILSSFDAAGFVEDLALMVVAPPQTEEDNARCEQEIVADLYLKGIN